MTYLTDGAARHLICLPYSVEGLHQMAKELGIKRCWFHAGRFPHYDVPKKQVGKLGLRVQLVGTREIHRVIKAAGY